ncbi:exosortase/archaeosortase family protein [Planctomycetaceae bacterium SH139]
MSKSNRRSRARRHPKPVMPAAVQKKHPRTSGDANVQARLQEGKAENLSYPSESQWLRKILPGAALLAVAILYAYWPTLQWAEEAWRNEPDYSHGYLVIPLAGLLLWNRRDSMPGFRCQASLLGLGLILLAIATRGLSRLMFADFLDGWSLLLLVGGVIWFLFGRRIFWWSLPAVLFLVFMIPLPFQAESMLSWKLQGVATHLSTTMLRIFGQPAVSEAHVVWINDQQLMIEEACSGMRIFIGVAALAFFWAAMVTRSWIDRIILLAAIVPLAVFVNAARITFVGIAYQFADGAAARQMLHDFSGYLMIPIAFSLLWLLKSLWQNLYRPLVRLTAKDFISPRAPASSPS